MTHFDDVGEFHRKFGLPHFGDGRPPEFLTEDVLAYRVGFVAEEFLIEFMKAHARRDMAGCQDALNDAVYVLLGLAHLMALPFDAGWDEVQTANMSKERATGADDPRSKRGHRLDVVKPENFVPPNHDPILIRAAIDALGLDPRAIIHFRGKTFSEFMTSSLARSAMTREAAE